jgi:hypothetical protein
MSWRGGMTLGSRLSLALGQIAVDRVLELGGASLPRTPDQVADIDSINRLLTHYDNGSLPPVSHVSLPGISFESSNCQNFLVAVEWDRQAVEGESLPETLYVKLPCHELSTRAFANAVGFWAVECCFARNVAAHVPIRVPRVFAVAERGARFVLLLENLCRDPGVRLFDNRDMAAGTSVERARLCLETFAELHAAFWNIDGTRREALLPHRLHTYLAPGGRGLTQALNSAAISPTHRNAPEIFGESHAALCRRVISKWDTVVDAWYDGPLTLIHGDSHLANCFEYQHEGASRMGMIDFQGMQWCHGIRDVQYFLINSLDPELLAANESDLIDHYIAALGRHGVELDPATARERYCAYSFQTLMVATVSFGLGSLTERDETLRTILARSVAAVDRLGFGEWLDRL